MHAQQVLLYCSGLCSLYHRQAEYSLPKQKSNYSNSAYADYKSGYKSVLLYFMKKQFLRSTDEEVCHLDPSETFSHVELKQVYPAINAAKILKLEVLKSPRTFLFH